LYPTRFRFRAFAIEGQYLRLAVAKGHPPLRIRLSRALPYPPTSLRAVTLVGEAGRLFVDVSAEVAVEDHGLDPSKVAGVDVGIIHPYALAGPSGVGLVISGRALRAEERLHLEDTKRRSAEMGRKAPRRGQRGSRRWRKLRATQRAAEARHTAKIRQAHHEAAKGVVAWAIEREIGTLVIGDPKGITANDSGRRQNRRVNTTWRRAHLTAALVDKARVGGIHVELVDERGTSSTCPACGAHQRAVGRVFACSACGLHAHRDLVGATNIARSRPGGIIEVPLGTSITHRRAGSPPARRDRRRHRFDTRRTARRSCPTPGRPFVRSMTGSRSRRGDPATASAAAGSIRAT
jgi:putative transposase